MREPLVESPLVHAKIVDFLCELLRPAGPQRVLGALLQELAGADELDLLEQTMAKHVGYLSILDW